MPILYKKGLVSTVVDFIEVEIGKKLPSGCRDFLYKMNGLYFSSPHYAQIPLKAVDEGVISFDRFFGFLPDEECNDIVSFNKEFIDELRFLPNAIAIGEDGGGNPYVLIGGDKKGVYYWDRTHLHESDSINFYDIAEQEDSGNLFLVASTFSEFYSLVVESANGNPDFVEEI
ncbi:SMI1/KNR4 family protein [Pseudomonas sp. F3-2]|uniref:SMI1/KNR4 family protein n=1 Tax=Pseudomonas sp. F3-2 TaxID=3141539 RepID=UPI00315D1DA0